MRLPLIPKAAAVAVLLALLAHVASAADTSAAINGKLKAGTEIGWVIEDSTAADGDLAVLFTARRKGAEPSKFPYIVSALAPGETDALSAFDEANSEVDDHTVMENVVVSLKDKRVLGRLNLGKPEDQVVYFPGKNHGSLQVLWGPEEEGWHFGVLVFGAKWASTAVLLVESDGERLRQLDIAPVLDASTNALLKTALKGVKGHTADDYAISYGQMSVVDPDAGYSVGNPVTVEIVASAEVPKSTGDEPYVEATLTVLLETSPAKISAKVLKAEPNKR